MPRFESRTHLEHPRDEVTAWHARPGALTRLTPPGYVTVTSGPTNGTRPGSELRVRLTHPFVPGLGGMLPLVGDRLAASPPGVDWSIVHDELRDASDGAVGFADEQLAGPFEHYRHEHLFEQPKASTSRTGGATGTSDASTASGTALDDGTGTTIVDRVEWRLPRALSPGNGAVARQFGQIFAFRRRQLTADLALHAQLAPHRLRIGITGASGTVGTQLAALAESGGHEVVRFVRGGLERHVGPGEARWDPQGGTIDMDTLASLDAIVHLAGVSIGGRFTDERKMAIYASRVRGTRTIARALAQLGRDAPRLVQASAIGGYGARRPGELLTEDSPLGDDFLAEVVGAWEHAASEALEAGVPTVFVRTGLVLTTGPGALLPQVPISLLGAGGPLTARDRSVSWITLDDLARLYLFAAAAPSLEGPLNAIAPEVATAGSFAETLGRVLHRPAVLPVPSFGPALLLGREGADELVETDQAVSGTRAMGTGFVFAHPALEPALRHVLVRGGGAHRVADTRSGRSRMDLPR